MKTRFLSSIAVVVLGITMSQALPALANPECDPAVNYLNLAREQYDLGEFNLAMDSYTCALNFDADSATAYLGRGNAARNLGQYQQAIDDYTRAIDLRENLAIAYNNRGWAHFNLAQYDLALTDYNLALQIDPNLAYAYNNRGLIYQMQGYTDLAADDFNSAIQLNIDPITWSQYNLQLLGAAVEETRVSQTATPRTTEPTLDALVTDAAQAWYDRQWALAIERYTAVIERDPENANAYNFRADSFYTLDRFEEALADYNSAVELEPANPYAIWGRAYTHAALNNFDSAYADYERAFALDPDHINNHYVLGAIEAMAGNAENAGAEFLAAIEMTQIERIEHETAQIGDSFTVELSEGLVYAIPFEGQAGQIVTPYAHSTEADPLIVLLVPDGKPIAGDDDSCTQLDPMISDFVLPTDGTYTLLVSHAGGGSYGSVDVSLIVG